MMKSIGKILILFMIFALAGCKGEKENVLPEVSTPEKVVPQLDESILSLGMKAAFPAENILELQGKGRVVKLVSGSAAAFVDGIPLQLPAPVTLTPENFWCIDPAAAQNILLPLMEKRSFPIRKIVLDPGHGGHDKGAVSADGIMEKDLNLQLASAIAEELEKCGFEVLLTRQDDRFLTLDERPAFAAEKQADIFISIHHNASKNTDAYGSEVFLLKSENEEENKRIISSWHPAFAIAKELTVANFSTSRGVKTARFKVLRLSTIPAILIEAGFVSNKDEVKKLADPVHQKVFAKLTARALLSFHGKRK